MEPYWFEYDIQKQELISECTSNPTDVTKEDSEWLWAINNKYDNDDIDDKVGKWMLFLPKPIVNKIWNQIKGAIRTGHLWQSKVSTTDPNSFSTYAIMIYTKDYTDLDDVISVLNYLESSGIKPAHIVIKYKTDQQTLAGVYSWNKQKASIYASNTIRQLVNSNSN